MSGREPFCAGPASSSYGRRQVTEGDGVVIYQKNLYAWEQICRVFLGLAFAVGAWWALSAGLVSYLVIASGAILATIGGVSS